MKKKYLMIMLLQLLLVSCGTSASYEAILPSTQVSTSISTGTSAKVCDAAHSYGDKGTPKKLDEDGYYTTRNDVALYLYTFHKLPSNYVTKDSGERPAGSSTRIGGDYFSNKASDSPTGLCLPNLYKYTECDVDASGTSSSQRGTHRIVYSFSFKIFYTYDHYEHWQEYLGYNNWGPTFSNGYYVQPCN